MSVGDLAKFPLTLPDDLKDFSKKITDKEKELEELEEKLNQLQTPSFNDTAA